MFSKLVPAQTSPLTKFIRTLEGQLLVAFNAAMVIVPIVTHALPATSAAKWTAILDAVAVVSRTGLKVISALASAKLGVVPGTQTLSSGIAGITVKQFEGKKVTSDPVAVPSDSEEYADAPAQMIEPSDVRPETATKPDLGQSESAGGGIGQVSMGLVSQTGQTGTGTVSAS